MGLYANFKKDHLMVLEQVHSTAAHKKIYPHLKVKKKSLMSNLTFHRFGKHTGFF